MKRARHLYFKAYPASWMIEAVMKSQAKIAYLHYGRGEETVEITADGIREALNPAYEKIAQALSLYYKKPYESKDLFGMKIDHNLVSGQLIVSVEHRSLNGDQRYNVEFIQAAGNWTLPERCVQQSGSADRLTELARITTML